MLRDLIAAGLVMLGMCGCVIGGLVAGFAVASEALGGRFEPTNDLSDEGA